MKPAQRALRLKQQRVFVQALAIVLTLVTLIAAGFTAFLVFTPSLPVQIIAHEKPMPPELAAQPRAQRTYAGDDMKGKPAK